MMAEVLFITLVGFVTSFLSNIAGGSGSVILLPLLLALGVSPPAAVGTDKLTALGLVIGSSLSAKGKKVVRKDYLKPLLGVATLASVIGPLIALNLEASQVRVVSSALIVITAIASIVSWKVAHKPREVNAHSKYFGYLLYFLVTCLLAGFGSAGLLNTYILIGFLGMSAIETISTRRIVGLVGVPIQLLLFARAGQINWEVGVGLLVASLGGGYLGLNSAIKLGNQIVKRAMAVVSIILVISLFI